MHALAMVLALSLAVGSSSGGLVDRNGDQVFRYACIGDSNAWEWGGINPIRTWCGNTPDHVPSVSVVGPDGATYPAPVRRTNQARIGATLCAPPANYPYRVDGTAQLETTIARGDVDAVVIALGTNDSERGVKKMKDCMKRLVDRAESAGLQVFVATIPPNFLNAAMDKKNTKVNTWIRKTYPDSYIDFNAGFPQALFKDGIHFNAAGQERVTANVAAAFVLAQS